MLTSHPLYPTHSLTPHIQLLTLFSRPTVSDADVQPLYDALAAEGVKDGEDLLKAISSSPGPSALQKSGGTADQSNRSGRSDGGTEEVNVLAASSSSVSSGPLGFGIRQRLLARFSSTGADKPASPPSTSTEAVKPVSSPSTSTEPVKLAALDSPPPAFPGIEPMASASSSAGPSPSGACNPDARQAPPIASSLPQNSSSSITSSLKGLFKGPSPPIGDASLPPRTGSPQTNPGAASITMKDGVQAVSSTSLSVQEGEGAAGGAASPGDGEGNPPQAPGHAAEGGAQAPSSTVAPFKGPVRGLIDKVREKRAEYWRSKSPNA